MNMRATLFRYCMLASSVALISIAVYYFVGYLGVSIAVGNNGLKPYYQQSIRALWLGFCLQSLLLGVLFALSAYRPHAISRPVMVICGLLPMFEAVLLFSFTGNFLGMLLVATAALLVLFAAALWPAPPPLLPATTPLAAPAAPPL
jgi:hypothetical protein